MGQERRSEPVPDRPEWPEYVRSEEVKVKFQVSTISNLIWCGSVKNGALCKVNLSLFSFVECVIGNKTFPNVFCPFFNRFARPATKSTTTSKVQ